MYVEPSSNLTTLWMCHLFASAWSQTRGRTDERSLTASEKKNVDNRPSGGHMGYCQLPPSLSLSVIVSSEAINEPKRGTST